MADKIPPKKPDPESNKVPFPLSESQFALFKQTANTVARLTKDIKTYSENLDTALSAAKNIPRLNDLMTQKYFDVDLKLKNLRPPVFDLAEKTNLAIFKSIQPDLLTLTGHVNNAVYLTNPLIKAQGGFLTDGLADNQKALSSVVERFNNLGAGILKDHMEHLQASQFTQFTQLTSIVDAQLKFVPDFSKLIPKQANTDLLFSNISKKWVDSLFNFKADFAGLKLDLTYQKKEYQERRQMVIQLDNVKVENGLEVYREFEKEGKKYKLVAIPESELPVMNMLKNEKSLKLKSMSWI